MSPRVELFPTCIVDSISTGLGASVMSVLERLGFDVSIARRATCCGQPAWNSGFADEAAAVARTTLDALDGDPDTVICVPAGSCATMMRIYWPELFRIVGDARSAQRAAALIPRIKEFSELVSSAGPVRGSFPFRVAYHKSCHMLRELGISEQPITLLEGLDGCDTVRWRDDLCCGFGGTFAVKEPEVSVAMTDAKIDSLLATDAEVLVGCDRSCLMQMESRMRRRGIDLPVRHLADVLADALEAGM